MSDGVKVIEGNMVVPPGARFAIVASRFNDFIVGRLVEGAIDALVRHGAERSAITVVRVPGAWEIPLAVKRVLAAGNVDAVIALGALIRGATAHFDAIMAEVTKGLGALGLEQGVPVSFGVLTTDTIEQAVERAGSKAGNKGAEAAVAAIEMVSLMRELG
ncbi:MAG: 6,7-dimethyl-8-ribityllumazine synthase [Deltaproteobacteria bacterium]|nr:6,7-dimethyl-8-ribityllumazine synthase [Deltaproteobacteria bacterium]